MSITHIYLSPHLDDAALSCGGTIWKQTQAGQHVIVINVFAGTPNYSQLPAFAREKHAEWGSPDDVVAVRQAEDRAALAVLGGDAVYWSYLDAIYRVDEGRALYPSKAGIFGGVDPADDVLREQLVEQVEATLDAAGDATCYAPLAIGHHVDHQLVRDAGLALVNRGRRVIFYEDFPYVWWETRRGEAGRGEASGRPISGPDAGILPLASPLRVLLETPGEWEFVVRTIEVEPKIAAIACYKSQTPDLFGSAEEMAEAVREYALSAGSEHYAERFWHVPV